MHLLYSHPVTILSFQEIGLGSPSFPVLLVFIGYLRLFTVFWVLKPKKT